jgi:hypothetical protein
MKIKNRKTLIIFNTICDMKKKKVCKHNWETQLIEPNKLGTICTNCGILKTDWDKKYQK